MSNPRIGRAYEKASNALAYQARKLREEGLAAAASPDPEPVLDFLLRRGDEFENEQEQRQREEEIRKKESDFPEAAVLRRLVEKAHEYIDDGARARAEATPLLKTLEGVKWQALWDGVTHEHGMARKSEEEREASPGSAYYAISTRERIAMLRASARALREYIEASDDELRKRLSDAERVDRSYSISSMSGLPLVRGEMDEVKLSAKRREYRYAIESMRRGLSYGSSGEAIRGKLGGIKRLISEIGADVLAIADKEEN